MFSKEEAQEIFPTSINLDENHKDMAMEICIKTLPSNLMFLADRFDLRRLFLSNSVSDEGSKPQVILLPAW